MRRWAIALVMLVLAGTGSAQGKFYNGTISVTATNSVVAFTDNGSGGTGQAMSARHVLVRSDSTSANTCYFDLKDTLATSADTPLEPGAAISFEFDLSTTGGVSDGWTGLGAVCASAETATFYVTATR